MPGESANIDSLNVKVEASSSKAAKAMADVVSALTDIKNVAPGANKGLNETADAAEKASKGFKGTAAEVSKLASTLRGMGLNEVAKEFKSIAQTAAKDNGLDKMSSDISNLADSFDKLGQSDTADSLRKSLDPIARECELLKEQADAAEKAATENKKAAETVAKIGNASRSASKGTRSLKKETGGLKAAFEKVTKPIKNFTRAIGRIIMYRAIRTVIKEIGQAIREGLSNLNEYSKAVGTDFAKAVESLKKHANLLKNAFATALRPVIEALIPVIEQLCAWLARAADFLAQVFSVITGKVDDRGRYTKAVLGDLEESTEQAKELKRTLLGFDEINRLDGDTGGGSGTSVGTQFIQEEISPEARETAERLQAIIERIKTFINDTDWEAVTGFLGLAMTVLGFATGSIPTIIAGAVLLASNIEAVSRALDKAKRKVTQFADKLKKATDTGDEDFDKFKNTAIEAAETVVQSVLDITGTVSEQISDTVETAGSIIQKVFSGDMQGALNDFVSYLGRSWERAKKIIGSIGDIIEAVINGIVLNAIGFGVEWVRKKISGLLTNLIAKLRNTGTLGGAILASFLTFVKDLSDNIFGIIGEVIDWAKSTVSSFIEIVKRLLDGDLKGAFGVFVIWLIGTLESLINIAISVLNIIISAVLNLVINPIIHAVAWLYNNAIVPVVNWIAQAIYDIARKVTQVMEDIANGIQDGLKWVWNNVILKFLNTLMSGVVGKINDIIEWSNRVLGTEIKPIDLQVIPDWEPERYDFALPEQTITILTEWEVTDLQLEVPKVDLSQWKEAVRSAFLYIKEEALSVETMLKRQKKEAQEMRVGTPTITAYANGGYPTAGSMFIAGEAGPEYVGSFGGQTGVWNSDQMSAAIYNAMSAALANMPQQGGDIYLDGQVIYKNVVRRNNNYVRSTGRTALLT